MNLSGDYSLPSRIKARHRVFARRLLPLTPRRIDLISAFGLESVFSEQKVDRIALRQLALILSIRNPARLFRRMHPRHPLTLLWRLRTALFGTRSQAGRLDAYLSDYSAVPELWRQEQAGRGGGAPRQLTAPWLLSQCLAYQRLTGRDPWEVPIDVMAWELATLNESEGGPTRFVTEQDRAIAEQVKAAAAPDPEAVEAYRRWQAERASRAGGLS